MGPSTTTGDSNRLAIYGWAGVLAGVLGAVSAFALLALQPAVGPDRYSYPLTPGGFSVIQAWFFVQHLGLLGALYGLWRSGATGGATLGRIGCLGGLGGMSLLAITELVAIAAADAAYPSPLTDVLDGLYGVASILIGLSLLAAGVAVMRARRWQGWRRMVPLLLGAYVFVPLTPAIFASFALARLALAGWMLGFALLGWAIATKPPERTPLDTTAALL